MESKNFIENAASIPPRHRVIFNPVRHVNQHCEAHLLIDETHPYFFDHPLDHVPGILTLAGILQLAEWRAAPGEWINYVKLGFRRYCEKDAEVAITLHPGAPGKFHGEVCQSGHTACQFDLGVAPWQAPRVAQAHSRMKARAPAELLHKHRPENVLVTSLFDLPGGLKAAETFPPPADHLFASENTEYHSMLYVLETTRQFLTLIAHTVWELPLGLPMNLLLIRLGLSYPLLRNQPLTISYRPSPLTWHRDIATVIVEMSLSIGDTPIGTTTIAAQVMKQEAYKEQRAGAHGDGDLKEKAMS